MKINTLITLIFTVLITFSCAKKETEQVDQTPVVTVKTSSVKSGEIENTITLNGKTVILNKTTVTSPITGYVLKMNIKYGDVVTKNEVLFEIQTKENKALENSEIGNIKVLAPVRGTINSLLVNETGSYVMEGTELCRIIENNNLMVQVNVPFEYNSVAKPGLNCKLFLPDNTSIEGSVYKVLPYVDEVNQTQQVLIKPKTNRTIPENLNLTVKFVLSKHFSFLLIPKSALMSNETQTEFWVMKMNENKMAIKVPVKIGIENDSIAEITSADLNTSDLIISEGAYGLSDSTKVSPIQ